MILEYTQKPGTDTYAIKQQGVTIGLITKGRFYAYPLSYSLEEIKAIAEFLETI